MTNRADLLLSIDTILGVQAKLRVIFHFGYKIQWVCSMQGYWCVNRLASVKTKTTVILGGISGSFIEITEIMRFSDGSGYQSLLSINSGEFSCSKSSILFQQSLESFTKNVFQAYDIVEGNARLGCVFQRISSRFLLKEKVMLKSVVSSMIIKSHNKKCILPSNPIRHFFQNYWGR